MRVAQGEDSYEMQAVVLGDASNERKAEASPGSEAAFAYGAASRPASSAIAIQTFALCTLGFRLRM
jgi:hypothetical protein